MKSTTWKAAARLAAAGLLGYALIAVLTGAGFNGWLAGADLYRGGALLQAKGTLVALVAGLAGGALAAAIGPRRPLLHAAAVLPLLVADTLYVLFFFAGPAPWWFDLAGSLVLMASTLVGGTLVDALARRRAKRPLA
jgi:hypothetical protein